jgi:alpha,alpha-trehalase
MPKPAQAVLSAQIFDVAIFDLDGVITDTASTHAAAWKRLFDSFLRERDGAGFRPFDIENDYLPYVDGRPRYEGVRTFLESRDIELPYGDPTDSADTKTICGLGNAKNQYFRETVASDGVKVFDDALTLIQRFKSTGFAIAVVTASKNCDLILESVGLADVFDTRVDGVDIEKQGLKGKPAPDSFLEAARRLGAQPSHCVVFEDAFVGVEAGKKGGFGLVVGVDRHDNPTAFLEHGADIAVPRLDALEVVGLPAALDRLAEIVPKLKAQEHAVCLDYDGTLTPIVSRPDQALISESMQTVVRELGEACTVAIVSGRAYADIRKLVGLDMIYLADHGFELADPTGSVETYEAAAALSAEVAEVARKAEDRLGSIPGALVEPKPFSVAIHYRLVEDADLPKVHGQVDQLLKESKGLRLLEGKKVHEFRPDLDWDKGKAVQFLANRIGVPLSGILYIGDDVTDEDVFRDIRDTGIGIVVWDSPRQTAAGYALSGPDEVELFLKRLAEALSAHDCE